MIAALILMIAVLSFPVAIWFFGPDLIDDLFAARRRHHIRHIKRRTLADMEYVRERGWQDREQRGREQLRRIADEYDL